MNKRKFYYVRSLNKVVTSTSSVRIEGGYELDGRSSIPSRYKRFFFISQILDLL
jgi:hypothetical protein